jgi:hypothetical protein
MSETYFELHENIVLQSNKQICQDLYTLTNPKNESPISIVHFDQWLIEKIFMKTPMVRKGLNNSKTKIK